MTYGYRDGWINHNPWSTYYPIRFGKMANGLKTGITAKKFKEVTHSL